MLNERKIEKALNEFDSELKQNKKIFQQFRQYCLNITFQKSDIIDVISIGKLQDEFLVKCQWFQLYAKKELGMQNISMEVASTIVSKPEAASFSKDVSDDLFDGFIHFLVANEKRHEVLSSLMSKWIASGRGLEELDKNHLSPMSISVYHNNVSSFTELYKKGICVTDLDKDGFSPLHVIVNKIAAGTGNINFIKIWIDLSLPTDMLSGKAAGINAGKTALEFAKTLNLAEIIELFNLSQNNSYLAVRH